MRFGFFYGVTLDQATIPERIAYAREPRKLPTMLSADEVVRFLESVSSLKARVALTTAYAAGLRVSEVAALKVRDIDSGRMGCGSNAGRPGKERYRAIEGEREAGDLVQRRSSSPGQNGKPRIRLGPLPYPRRWLLRVHRSGGQKEEAEGQVVVHEGG